MDSLYTNELRDYMRSRPWPKSLVWEVVEFEDCLKVALYRDNINALDSDDKLALAATLNETLMNVQRRGIPIHTWVKKGDGRSAKRA